MGVCACVHACVRARACVCVSVGSVMGSMDKCPDFDPVVLKMKRKSSVTLDFV